MRGAEIGVTDGGIMGPLVVAHVVIPEAELRWTAVRASGPGGQNVNKVASKIDLRFDFEQSAALSDELKARIRVTARARLDAEGRLQITSQLTRNQPDNLEDARSKLAEIVRSALVTPKKRRKTKPSRAKKAARVAEKRVNAQKKQSRGRVALD
ncbi:MAG TPA: alternative ribosome rescue aminoacyl-tRNA hydrolase ArfB [Polyangiaceae bacterium]|nr:alternative ribosome rescue aminoacyl-tRNA hydrolase ArfB [Polyangiaceae bacterium]